MDKWYPKTKEDRMERNRIEIVVMTFFMLGVITMTLTKQPISFLLSFLSIPVCFKMPCVKNFITYQKK